MKIQCNLDFVSLAFPLKGELIIKDTTLAALGIAGAKHTRKSKQLT